MTDHEAPLSDEEQEQLTALLRRMKWPLPRHVFYALVHNTVSVAIELIVFDADGNILIEYRKDTEYDGYALPGTVLRQNEDVLVALRRLEEMEIKSRVTDITDLGWKEILQGIGEGRDRYRHYIPLLYACRLTGEYTGVGEFYPWDQLPATILSHEKAIIEEVVQRLKESYKHLIFFGK